jgi:hypothetical protein
MRDICIFRNIIINYPAELVVVEGSVAFLSVVELQQFSERRVLRVLQLVSWDDPAKTN